MAAKKQHVGTHGLPMIGDLCWAWYDGAPVAWKVAYVTSKTYGVTNPEAFVNSSGDFCPAGELFTLPPYAHHIDSFRPLSRFPEAPEFDTRTGYPLDYVTAQQAARDAKRGLSNLF